MDDQRFVRKLNAITREHGLVLPTLGPNEAPSSAFLAVWAKFLEICVKQGFSLSDDRWQHLAIDQKQRHSHFRLETEGQGRTDEEFRIGLQLLMGMLGDKEKPATP